jgi:crossover junction endodeoxyribonuclease RuvC
MKIVGLDLSLTSTGVAEWEDSARRTYTFGSKGKAGATLEQRAARLDEALVEAQAAVFGGHQQADLVLVEAHTFAAKGGQQHDRSGLWWLVVHDLVSRSIPTVEVPPSSIKLFATGKGNAPKDAVLMAVARRHADMEFTTNDEADAITLVDMALARWSHDEFDPTAYQLRAIEKIVWPEGWAW